MTMKGRRSDGLNIAGRLARSFLHSKLSLLIILASLLFGAFALNYTARTYNPEIVVPVVNVAVNRPGSGAEEVLNQLVRPLEGLMASIPGVDHTYGMAVDDNALVTVRFKVSESEEDSLVKVYNQINSHLNQMPSGTYPPLVQSISLYDVPFLTITLSSKEESPIDLRAKAGKLLEQLRNVPQVGKSWVMGSSVAAVRVWLNPEKMSAHYISLDNIKRALTVNNVSLDAGDLNSGRDKTSLRLEAQFIHPNDVANIIIGVNEGKPVYLKDIARIERAPLDDAIQSYYAAGRASPNYQTEKNLTNAVTLAIARQKGSNGVDVANEILNRLKLVEKNGDLLQGIKVNVTRNYGADANDAVNTLIEHLGIAVLSVIVILFLFLGWREASVVIFSIPIILCLVLVVGWLSGQTINRITLFALILSLGLLVDDSIVVIENIHRHMSKSIQHNFGRLVVAASNEIGKPTIIATFTVILALIPMAFVKGMMGPFMAPIPFNAPLAMLISLIVAYTVVPYLAYRWLKPKARRLNREAEKHPEMLEHSNSNKRLHKFYVHSFGIFLEARWRRHLLYYSILGLLLIVLLQPLWQFIRPAGPNGPLSFGAVSLKMLPDDNVNTFLLEIDAGAGVALKETKAISRQIADVLSNNAFVDNYQIFLGESAPEDFAAMVRGDAMQQGSNYGQIRVNLISKHDRSVGSHQIAQALYEALAGVRKAYPLAHIKLFETPPGPPVRSQMEAGLYGPDYQTLRELAKQISQTIYPQVYGMINIDNSVTEDLVRYGIIVNRNAAVLAGLMPGVLANEISGFFRGVDVGSIHQPGVREPEKIILRLPDLTREHLSALEQLKLKNTQSQLLPLARVVEFKERLQNKPYYTRDQHPVAYVTGEMLFSSPAYGVATVTQMLGQSKLMDDLKLNVGNLGFVEAQPNDISDYQLFWLGEMRLTLDVFRDLGSAFILAIILIYFLLTGFYRSFFIPLIIMGAIPLTIIGVFPGHWIMQQPFTATSMIGVIALAGIVVRNSLLLIDFILEHQKAGYPVETAVLEAGRERLLPILLTALAIILGSAVMLSDPVFGGLAISLIFGAFSSTVLTLYLIPLVYFGWWMRRNHR